jgi:hypothetical protein
LLHGNLAAAARYNALTLAALTAAVPVYAVWTHERVQGRSILRWHGHRWAAPVAVVVVSAWFVVRNLPFAPFTALRV